MEISAQWLAGFFDGEGTFHLGKQLKKSNGKTYPHFTVMLSQSGEDGRAVLVAVQEQYGGFLYQHLKAGQHKATKPAYKLYWNADEALPLIESVLPFLLLKKEAAAAVKKYLERKQDGTKTVS